MVFRADSTAEIRLVEPEVVIRRFLIRSNGLVTISNSVVALEQLDTEDELSVDEDTRDGKRLKVDSPF